MSYDLEAFHLPPGTDPGDYESELDDRPPTPEERAAMERLGEAVLAVDPSAERHDGDDFIEIDTEDAIQVSLYANEAGISVPYWYEGEQAEAVMARVFEYAAVLREIGGYTVYDPQTGEVVEGPAGRHSYAAGVEMLHSVPDAAPPRQSWWRRLFS
jgi:hypothetical protein